MAAFPYYGAASIEALNSQASALLNLFGSHGYVREEPAVLQPAEIFLNRYGEEIRQFGEVLKRLNAPPASGR